MMPSVRFAFSHQRWGVKNTTRNWLMKAPISYRWGVSWCKIQAFKALRSRKSTLYNPKRSRVDNRYLTGINTAINGSDPCGCELNTRLVE